MRKTGVGVVFHPELQDQVTEVLKVSYLIVERRFWQSFLPMSLNKDVQKSKRRI